MSDPPFRLAIDGRAVRAPVAGIGLYVAALLRAMAAIRPLEVVIYLPCRQDIDLPGIEHFWRTDPWWPRGVPQTVWMRERVGAMLRGDRIDAFWGCSMAMPRCPKGIPGLLTLYDVVHLEAPDSMTLGGRIVAKMFFASDLRRADAAVAISAGTAKRIQDRYGHTVDGIARPDADPGFSPRPVAEVSAVLRRHGLEKPYALAVGTREPRKNYGLLLAAAEQVHTAGRLGRLKLAVAGRSGWGADPLARSARVSGAPIHHLGYVPRTDLPALMTGAEALLFPTRYEGFGMPALEAARCGTPVIAGDLPELREAASDALRPVSLTVSGFADALAALAQGGIHRPQPAQPGGWHCSAQVMWAMLELARTRSAAG